MPFFHHRLPFGAELQRDGTTRFRLWAPDAQHVGLMLAHEKRAIFELHADTDGWHEATLPVRAGMRYYYRIDDEQNVADPAARFAPEGVPGPVEVIDPCAFKWAEAEWHGFPWHRAVIYELHVGTFTPEGTFAAIIPRLRELADLGINTLELMPIAAFPGRRGWGYDGVLPFAPHPAYGRPDDLKRLVQAAHGSGIAVVIDVVYNHFGPQGNDLHRYARAFFTDRHHTPWGAALDFESAAGRNVREFFIQNALYWLNEYRFDGLRLDAIHAIRDTSEPHFVDELAGAIEAGPGRERYVHLILENHDNEARRLVQQRHARVSKAQWNDDFHHVTHVLLTGECDGYYANYVSNPHELLGRALAEGFAYQGEAYGAARIARGERSNLLVTTAFINFLQNHDQVGNRACGERLAQLTDTAQLRAGLTLLLLSPHVPMLFMGEEYAARQPFLYFCEFLGELADAVRHGRRGEFAHFAAFADEAARERIPDPNAQETFEASRLRWHEREAPAHRPWLDYVRALLHTRREHVIPRIACIEPGTARYEVAGTRISVHWPAGEQGVLRLDANLSDASCAMPAVAGARLIFTSTSADAPEQLAGWEVRMRIVSE